MRCPKIPLDISGIKVAQVLIGRSTKAMERILVALDPGRTTIWAAIHALNLARRIGARTYILMVPRTPHAGEAENRVLAGAQEELEPLIEKARTEGVRVEIYITYGEYDQEVVKFIRENKIDLLIIGVPVSSKGSSPGRFFDNVEKIRQRVDCRIEVVNERGIKITEKRSE